MFWVSEYLGSLRYLKHSKLTWYLKNTSISILFYFQDSLKTYDTFKTSWLLEAPG